MIENTGTDSIKCWRYTFPPGILATGIRTPPAGWQVGGNRPPPAPILGGRSATGIPPGGKAAFGFTTDRPFDTGRVARLAADPPGIANGSTDCVADFNMPVSYGSTPRKPKPKCRCKFLNLTNVRPEGLFAFSVFWTMGCIRVAGAVRARSRL